MAANSYLVVQYPAVVGVQPAALSAALAIAPMASILLGCPPAAAWADRADHLAVLIIAAQAAGAAVLLDDVALAKALRADGVHLGFAEDPDVALGLYHSARDGLGGDAIVGVDAGWSRHHAMVLGEAGADYIAFPGTDQDQQCELVQWWAELFEPPVVAWDVQGPDHARRVIAAQTDFIATVVDDAEALTAAARQLTLWLRDGG